MSILHFSIFFVGFLLGLFIALLVAYFLMRKKEFSFKESLAKKEHEHKESLGQLNEAHIKIASLSEQANTAKEYKDELNHTLRLLDESKKENNELKVYISKLESENKGTREFYKERINDLTQVHENMKNAFASLSQQALEKSVELTNASFKQNLDNFLKANEKDRSHGNERLKNILDPLKESLKDVDKKVADLEKSRQGAYSGLKEQVDALIKSHKSLYEETQTLAKAFYSPNVRGRWGEMQLKRVVELSGLSGHCDFVEQKSFSKEDDVLRPDMIVTLPKGKKIVIDAKAPLDSFYNDANKKSDEELAKELSTSFRRHLSALKKKAYFKALPMTPEFVVMFLPTESFLSKALSKDPSLIDYAAQNNIIIATPLTLVALLKAVAFGFRQEAIAENIEEVRRLSEQMIERIDKVSEHFENLGKHLRLATKSFNQTLSSLDSRVLVTARKLSKIKSLKSNKPHKSLEGIAMIEDDARHVTTPYQAEEKIPE